MVSSGSVHRSGIRCALTSVYAKMTNEFEFSIAAFHHAHETYLVPELLKKAYGLSGPRNQKSTSMMFHVGGPPAAALFATNARYKREAYRGSEFAASILADNGIQVVMKVRRTSDNQELILNLPF